MKLARVHDGNLERISVVADVASVADRPTDARSAECGIALYQDRANFRTVVPCHPVVRGNSALIGQRQSGKFPLTIVAKNDVAG